ncbi:hypothetical protein LTR85_010579 [Meristemomyces frigidus]|nr:hypothetical protein LTR85_010579 [Meristemomyces frigidus]
MSTETSTKTGSCLCGKIKYRLEGHAATPIYNTVCHCLNCRKWLGSAFLTASICSKNVSQAILLNTNPSQYSHKATQGFSITEGEDVLRRYVDDKTGSGKPLTRTFCGTCGSSLFAFTPLREDIVSVAAGTLDDFESWEPAREQWCIHRADFVENVRGISEESRHAMNVQAKPAKD